MTNPSDQPTKHIFLQHAILPSPPNIDTEQPDEMITLPNWRKPEQDFDRYVRQYRDGSLVEYCRFFTMHGKNVHDLNVWTVLVDESGEIYHRPTGDTSGDIHIYHVSLPFFKFLDDLPATPEITDDMLPDVDFEKLESELDLNDIGTTVGKCASAVNAYIRKHHKPPPFYIPVGKPKNGYWKDNHRFDHIDVRIHDMRREWRANRNIPYPVLSVTFLRTRTINGYREESNATQRIGTLYRDTNELIEETKENDTRIPTRSSPYRSIPYWLYNPGPNDIPFDDGV